MKNIILLLMLSVFCYACDECKTTNIISFTEKDKEWLIYQKDKVFTYTNQKNDNLVYITEKVDDFPLLAVNSSHGGFYPSPDEGCIKAKWDGIRVKLQNTATKRDSIDLQMRKMVNASLESYPDYGLDTRIYWRYNNLSVMFPSTKLLDSLNLTTFDTLKPTYPYFVPIPELLIKRFLLKNSKIFDNVMMIRDNRGTKIYYHKTTGIIRFETANGDIWELE